MVYIKSWLRFQKEVTEVSALLRAASYRLRSLS
jgi:hypothetical protein